MSKFHLYYARSRFLLVGPQISISDEVLTLSSNIHQITPGYTEVDSGSSLKLTCHVTGSPVSTLLWYKDGDLIRFVLRVIYYHF